MAIIYSYPTKAAPVVTDMVLISDSASADPKNQTKQASIASIKTTIDVVDSVVAGSGISVSSATGDVTIGNTGVLSITSDFGTYISGNSLAVDTGAIDLGSINLSAVDGTAVGSTKFLSKDNTWDMPPLYNGAGDVGYVPDGGSVTTFLRGDGNWVIPDNGVSGSGTQYNIPMFATTTTLGDSLLAQDAGATTITFGTAASGQVLDISGQNRISFKGDSTNSWIAADATTPESLEIHADQDLYLRPDNYVIINGAAAPATASSSGNEGSIAWDVDYFYVCVEDDVWKRAALSTW